MNKYLPLDIALFQQQAAVFDLPDVRLLNVTVRILPSGGVALEARIRVGKRNIKVTVSAEDIGTAWEKLCERAADVLTMRVS